MAPVKEIVFSFRPIDRIAATVTIAPIFEDVRPLRGVAGLLDWRLNGFISRLILEGRFRGEFEEVLLMPSGGRVKAEQIILLGVGPQEGFSEYLLPAVYRRILNLVARKRNPNFAFCLSDLICEKFEWRNSVRKFVSKLFDYDLDFCVTLCEERGLIQEAWRRHMDFGLPLRTLYEVEGKLVSAA